MDDEKVKSILRGWYERPFLSEIDPCQKGPRFVDSVEWVRSRSGLSPDEVTHVQSCPRCMRKVEAIRSELAALSEADADAGPARSEETGRRRRLGGLSILLNPPSRRWVGTGLAVACVLIGLALLWPTTSNRLALAEVGFAPSPPLAGFWLGPKDEAALRKADQAVAKARVELKEALVVSPPAYEAWGPWTQLYRNLLAMGRLDEALEQMHAFQSYAEERDRSPDRYSMYYSCLSDLGNTYQAIGDYEKALNYHRQSLAVARDYQDWFHRTGRAENKRPQAYAQAMANTLVPRLWALSMLSAAQGDLQLAWDYHNQAGSLLADYFRQECRQRGLTVAAGAPAGRPDEASVPTQANLYDLCMTIVLAGDSGLESLVVKVREHLLRRARLFRQDRDLDAASQALRLGSKIPPYPFADESRLDFNEPMESLKIAIARGDFTAALDFADEVQRHTGSVPLTDSAGRDVSKPPISVLARAELRFLRGVARAGLDPDDPDSLSLIESAIQAVQQSAQSLPETQQTHFLNLFSNWQRVFDRIRTQQSRLSATSSANNAFDAVPMIPSRNGREGGVIAMQF